MIDYLPFFPLTLVFAGAIFALVATPLRNHQGRPKGGRGWGPPAFCLAVLTVALLLTVRFWIKNPPSFHEGLFDHRLVMDNFAAFLSVLVLACAAATVVAFQPYARQEAMDHPELYSLILFATGGALLLVLGADLLVLFLGLEIMSVSVYGLVGIRRESLLAGEATLKYVLLGAFSSAVFLFGLALIYGVSGSCNLYRLGQAQDLISPESYPLYLVGLMLLLAGLAFKVGAFPFHMWVPDVYQGAAIPVTGYMATAVKIGSFGILLRMLLVGFGGLQVELMDVLWWLAVFTMFAGNVMALLQQNLKRMLAYSSIAHTGYLLVGLAVGISPHSPGASAVLFYLAAYAATTLAAFACVAYLGGSGDRLVELPSLRGAARKHPWMAIALGVCMFSLMGMPPTAGFLGKYLLFSAAIGSGQTALAVLGIANSLLSVWYYLRVVVTMTMEEASMPEMVATAPQPGAEFATERRRWGAGVCAIVGVLAVIWAGVGTFSLLGILPGAEPLLSWARLSIDALF